MESVQQRLFRLTSDSSDGIFDTTFNQDIQIKAGSTVALQSLSFDRQSDQITIDSSNNRFVFGLLNATGVSNWQAKIPSGVYPKVTRGEELMDNITRALNARINMSDAAKNIDDSGYPYSMNKGAQWKMDLGVDGRALIQAKTQFSCEVSNAAWSKTNAFTDTTVVAGTIDGEAPTITDPSTPLGADSYISRPAQTVPPPYSGDKNHSYVYGRVRMNKGTGCIRARIRDLVATTAGQHSFTMGLTTDLAKLQTGTITNAEIHYGLQCHQPTEAYHVKTSAGGTFVAAEKADGTALEPELFEEGGSYDAESSTNDVLEIRIEGARSQPSGSIVNPTLVGMSVHQQTGETVLGETVIPAISQDTDFYWFISFHQDDDALKLDFVQADLDSYAFTQIPAPGALADSGLTSVISGLTPNDLGGLTFPAFNFRFQFPSIDVARYFGYPVKNISRSGAVVVDYNTNIVTPKGPLPIQLWNYPADRRAEFSIEAKNYLILFDNIPLESFDTYSQHSVVERNANTGGSRRNLLSCVPTKEDLVAGSSISRVVYEPSSLQYISMNNRNAMITRSFKCRLVTSTYQPVSIDGLASMTILIKD